jgi:chromosome segregation protein
MPLLRRTARSSLDELSGALAAADQQLAACAAALELAQSREVELAGLDADVLLSRLEPSEAAALRAEIVEAVSAAEDAHARAEAVVEELSRRAADEAEVVAVAAVELAQTEVDHIDGAIARIEAELASLRAERAPFAEALEDLEADAAEARLPYARGEERTRVEQRERQSRERLRWHVKHSAMDADLSRRDLAWVRQERARLRTEAHDRQRAQQQQEANLVVEDTADLVQIDRIRL